MECDNYACAKAKYSTSPIISPGYMILGGVSGNEGAIITRDKFGADDITELTADKWFLVQTNDDHFAG